MHSQDRSRFAKEGLSGRLRLTLFFALVVIVGALFVGSRSAHAANPCLVANDVGQDLENTNKLRAARAQYVTCSQKSCNPTIRTDCESFLKRVDDKMPTVVVKVVDSRGQDVPGAEVTIDDEKIALDGTAVAVDPGQRHLQAKVKAGDVAEQKPLIVVKEKGRVVTLKFSTPLTPDGNRVDSASSSSASGVETVRGGSSDSGSAADRPTKKKKESSSSSALDEVPTATYVLGSIGVVALGVFAYFEIAGQNAHSDLQNTCAPSRSCKTSDVEAAKDKLVIGAAALGVSLVAIAGAAYFYFTRSSSSSSSSTSKSTTGLRFAPAPGGAALVF